MKEPCPVADCAFVCSATEPLGREGGEPWLVKHVVACRQIVLATRLVLILM